MKIYTRKGDDGTTGLLYGGRVPKDSAQPTAYGTVDELQAALGVARADADGELADILLHLERDLWVLMAELATDPDNRSKLVEGQSLVTPTMVLEVERVIDDVASRFELPREFVVPGQDRTSALLDLARTVVRRAERAAVDVLPADSAARPYLNRLSSLLWTLARWAEGTPLPTRTPSTRTP
jgi:cob(I)alamin adenosyltransferase